MGLRGFFFLFVLFLFSARAEIIENKDIRDVLPRLKALVAKYGAENVLFVTDFDNTVAETVDAVGGEPWFERLLDEFGETRYRDVILLQRALFKAVPGRLVQAETPQVIRTIQGLGVKTMLLTSRNREFFTVTDAELTRFGINLAALTLDFRGIPSRAFALVPNEDRKVLFVNGQYYTAGLPKGPALRALFDRAKWRPRAIVFLDDRVRHTESMEHTFAGTDVEIVSFRYGVADEKIERERAAAAHPGEGLIELQDKLRGFIPPKHGACHTLLSEILAL